MASSFSGRVPLKETVAIERCMGRLPAFLAGLIYRKLLAAKLYTAIEMYQPVSFACDYRTQCRLRIDDFSPLPTIGPVATPQKRPSTHIKISKTG
jgi:hypothetical protein